MVHGTGGGRGRSSPSAAAGPRHLAVPFTSPVGLAARLAREISGAVAAGDPVLAVLADDTRAGLTAALGRGADDVEFADPRIVHSAPAFTVAVRWARTSRRIGRPGGRSLVVGQRLEQLPDCGPSYWARLDIGLDVATAGLPVTVLCPFAGDGPGLEQVRATHPWLDTAGGAERSPDYRQPHDAVVDHPPPPPPDLGPPAAELRFAAAGLAGVRHLAAGCAEASGLAPERAADLVLAVNELASNSIEHGAGSGRLRLWSGDGVTAEVVDRGRMQAPPFPGLALPAPGGARGRGLWLASELCDVLQVWSDDQQTIVRVRLDR